MDKLSTNYALNYRLLHVPSAEQASLAANSAKAQAEPTPIGDSFEHGSPSPSVGYEKFSAYKLSSRLADLQNVDIPMQGVPSAVLLKSTLEAINEDMTDGDVDQLEKSGNPDVLMGLLEMLVERE
ncbi:MAG: hypothetical protein LBV04_09585 [Deferribacteraceae bacterium]|nr:hypothetical protein [Deferribacteraceae bacterium]